MNCKCLIDNKVNYNCNSNKHQCICQLYLQTKVKNTVYTCHANEHPCICSLYADAVWACRIKPGNARHKCILGKFPYIFYCKCSRHSPIIMPSDTS